MTIQALLAIQPHEASAEDPPELSVTAWRTDASGKVSFFDNGSWHDMLPPHSSKPAIAVYQPSLGLWGVRMDDGHIAYTEFQNFLHSTSVGKGICECSANSKNQPLSTRNFGDGDCTHSC